MKRDRIEDFVKGWFIGDFEPTIFKTRDFEVAYKIYDAETKEIPHYHKIANEFTFIVDGRVRINNKIFKSGDIIHIQPFEVSSFEAVESTKTIVIKIPSVSGDKYLVDSDSRIE